MNHHGVAMWMWIVHTVQQYGMAFAEFRPNVTLHCVTCIVVYARILFDLSEKVKQIHIIILSKQQGHF